MSIIPHFEMSSEPRDDATQLIHVKGEIHVSTAPEFAARLDEAIATDASAVVLDLTEVEFIDSTGLSVLLNGLRRLTRRSGTMSLVCTNPTVLRLFEITRLDSTFDIAPTRDEAIARVQRNGAAGSDVGAP